MSFQNTSTSIYVSRFLLFLLPHWTTLCRIINACNFHTTYALLNQMKNQHNRSNKILQKLFKFSGSMNHLIVSEEKGPESGRSTWRYEHELEHLFLWQIESISCVGLNHRCSWLFVRVVFGSKICENQIYFIIPFLLRILSALFDLQKKSPISQQMKSHILCFGIFLTWHFLCAPVDWKWHEYMFGDFSLFIRLSAPGTDSMKHHRIGLPHKKQTPHRNMTLMKAHRLLRIHARLIIFWLIQTFFCRWLYLSCEIKSLTSTDCYRAEKVFGVKHSHN